MKKVYISGASFGIGKALAFKYAGSGAEVFITARSTDELEKICDEINSSGGKAHYMKCDVAVRQQVLEAADSAKEKMGKIDLAVLNAGRGGNFGLDEIDAETFENMFAVNTFGILYGLEAFFKIMKEQGGGTIAGVGSMADARGFPESAPYCSSKIAAAHLLEAARIEYRPYGINVITVKPGFVKTRMTAKNDFTMPLLMEPEKFAEKMYKFLEKRKSRIYYPRRMAFLTWLVKSLPSTVYEFMAGRRYKIRKMK